MFKKILIVLLIVCFLLGMATRKELESVKKTVNSAEVSADVGELKIELVQKIDSVADYLVSKDGEVLLYAPKKTGTIRASDVRILNIAEDPKTKVLSFKKTRSNLDVDPKILNASWTQLFDDKIIYKGDESGYYAGQHVIIRKLDGTILSKILWCYYDICIPLGSATGRYVALIPSYDSDYPSLEVYETETGKKIWEKFTPPDINKWYEEKGQNYNQFCLKATFIGDDSLAVYYDGKIWLLDVESGKTYWEKEIFQPLEEYDWSGSFISVTENGDILFFGENYHGPSYLYRLANTGKRQWEKVDVASTEISPKGKYVMILDRHLINLTDGKSGKSLWLKKTGEGGVLEVFYGLNDEYIIIEGESKEGSKPNEYITFYLDEYRAYNIFILQSSSGKIVEKFKGSQLSFSRERNILSFKNGDAVFFYQLTEGVTDE